MFDVITIEDPAAAGLDSEAPIDWSFQDEAVRRAVEELAVNRKPRTHIVSGCGTGKSATGAKIVLELARDREDARVLVLVPNLDLVSQLAAEYRTVLPPRMTRSIVAVCSEMRGYEDLARAAVHGHSVNVTTEPEQLAGILAQPGQHIVFCTYPSQKTLKAAHLKHGLRPWSIAIVDEAHRSAGFHERSWSAITDDRQIPCEKRLFMTATARIISGSKVISMDNREIYGECCFNFPASRARQAGVQAEPRMLVPLITDTAMHQTVTGTGPDAPFFHLAGTLAIDPRMLAVQIAVLKAARQLSLRRIITFHQRVPSARSFARTLAAANSCLPPDQQLPEVTALHLEGGHDPNQRKIVYDRMRADTPGLVVVSNAKMLGEGVNVPSVDCVVLVDPMKSTETVVQAIGRALRSNGDRTKKATVIVPVMVTDEESPEAALEDSAFAPVWTTLCALAADEDDPRATMSKYTVSLTGDRSSVVDAGPRPVLPDWLSFTGVQIPLGFTESIFVKPVKTVEELWSDQVARVVRIKEKYGHILPRKAEEPAYHEWANVYRRLHARGHLAPHKKADLDAVGFIWDVDAYYFAEAIKELEKLTLSGEKVKKGAVYGTPPRDLYNWRNHLNDGLELGRFTEEQIGEIVRIGFRRNKRPSWDEWFAMLLKESGGTNYIPSNARVVDSAGIERQLGGWMTKQIALLDKSKLTPQQAKLIIPFAKEKSRRTQVQMRRAASERTPLDQWLRVCAAYKEQHGHLDPRRIETFTFEGRDYKIGDWCVLKRAAYLKGSYSPAIRAQLESTGLRLTPRIGENAEQDTAPRAGHG